MKKLFLSIFSLSILLFTSCNKDVEPTYAGGSSSGTTDSSNVVITPATTYQTIESFAASDCWDPNYVGQYWTDTEKSAIAKLLFSKTISNGQPEGIGLSGWRFNLGGGTAQQGDDSNIESIERRAEAFIDPSSGLYDWTKAAGQQYFLEKARDYGVSQFVLFSNTPPVNWTQNGKGYSAMGAYSNLKSDAYDDFANYIATVVEYFKTNKNIDFSLVSPVNEPQYNWDGKDQEGSGWQNSEIKTLATEINRAFIEKGLSSKILLAEAAAWNYVYEQTSDKVGRSNVVKDLFDSSSSNYVGGLEHVAPIIAGHSYWLDGDWSTLTSVRSQVKASATAKNLKVYQTEWSMLGDGYSSSEFVGYDNASYMDIALYMSKVIHCDMVYANASSWSYWTSMACERYSQKNRFYLIRLIPAGGDYGDIRESGTHVAGKTLWVLGNYSLFVRPGYKRVDMQINGTNKTLFGSAYLSEDGKTLVAVYSNLNSTVFKAKTQITNAKIKSIKRYTTNSSSNLLEAAVDVSASSISINPQSVVTVVYTLE